MEITEKLPHEEIMENNNLPKKELPLQLQRQLSTVRMTMGKVNKLKEDDTENLHYQTMLRQSRELSENIITWLEANDRKQEKSEEEIEKAKAEKEAQEKAKAEADAKEKEEVLKRQKAEKERIKAEALAEAKAELEAEKKEKKSKEPKVGPPKVEEPKVEKPKIAEPILTRKEQILKSFLDKGITTATKEELKSAGLSFGFFSPFGAMGGRTGRYKISRKTLRSPFNISKI